MHIRLKASASLFALATMIAATGAAAAPIILEGNFVRTAVGDRGTMGAGGTTSPGIIHDKSGRGDFSLNDDYLTPGTPYENFSFESDETGLLSAQNTGFSNFTQTSLTDLSGNGADNRALWQGFYANSAGERIFEISNNVHFNDGDERIIIETTITPLVSLTNARFGRSLDPDPDVNRFGSFSTDNVRGLDRNNDGDFDDAGDIAPTDIVLATGTRTGQTIGLYTASAFAHNAGIGISWSLDPDFYLAGGDGNSTIGDHSIGLGFLLGNLTSGQSYTIVYEYLMGDSRGTVGGGNGEVPEPATLGLFAAGFAAIGVGRWRRRQRN